MKEKADFHVHLGNRSSDDLIEEALINKVSVVAVLDRGIVKIEFLRNLISEGQNKGITIIPGVESLTEISYDHSSFSTEILGLDFDIDHPAIAETFDPMGPRQLEKQHRKIQFQREFLEKLGFSLNTTPENHSQWETINQGKILETAITLCKMAVSDPNNKPILDSMRDKFENHFITRPQDQGEYGEAKCLFWKYFAQGKPGFKKWFLDYRAIIDAIHSAGGVVIIPHPEYQHKLAKIQIINILGELFDKGIDGVEGWDADQLDKEIARFALGKGKLVLGGSGEDKTNYDNRIMGKGDKNKQRMFISPRQLQKIRNYKQFLNIGRS